MQENKTVLLVAATTGYQTRAFAEAGRRLGIHMILATDRCHVLDNPWGDQAVPIRFEQPKESAAQLADLQIDGIVAVGDRPAWIAALAAEKLGVPFHPGPAVEAASDKHLARSRFAQAGLLAPDHYQISRDCPPPGANFYPCVLKPLALSASRGVIRADNDREFAAAASRIRAILEHPDLERLAEPRNRFIQVERYLAGREFALEGLVTRGKLQTPAIFDKPDPLDGPFFEETIYVTPSRETRPVQADLREAAQRAVTALGLEHGPVHAEMRVTERGVFVLEVAARPIGGLCSKALRFENGVSLEEIILRHALGEDPKIVGEALPGGVMMIPIPKSGIYHGVTGVEAAQEVPGISEVVITAKVGQKLEMLPEGASYLGFIFAGGENAGLALRQAHQMLSFGLQTALNITKSAC
jgi:biotin carboxylase